MLVSNNNDMNNANMIVYVQDVGALNYGGSFDHLCSVWCGRVFGFGILALSFAIAYAHYSYRFTVVDAQFQLELAEIQAKYPNENKKSQDNIRIIPFNTRRQPIDKNQIVLNDNLTIDKKKLIEFVTESLRKNGLGLAIGKWKSAGWDQKTIEEILDYMHSLNLVTARANGRACIYTGEYDSTYVLRKIAYV